MRTVGRGGRKQPFVLAPPTTWAAYHCPVPTLPADCSTSPMPRLQDEQALRGVLHDVGHGLLTLSLLLDSGRDALFLRFGAEVFELVEAEIARLLAMVHSGTRLASEPTTVGMRSLVEPFALVSRRTTLTKVWVRPGPEILVRTDPGIIWRVLGNLIDNAVRAAGPLGNVEISITDVNDTGPRAGKHGAVTIDVIDDGPGPQRGPAGLANLGLTVVNRLLDTCGGRLEVDEVVPHGTRMRVILPVEELSRAFPADGGAWRRAGSA